MHRSACVNLIHGSVFNPTEEKTRLIIKNERTNGHMIQSVPSQRKPPPPLER